MLTRAFSILVRLVYCAILIMAAAAVAPPPEQGILRLLGIYYFTKKTLIKRFYFMPVDRKDGENDKDYRLRVYEEWRRAEREAETYIASLLPNSAISHRTADS